MLRSETAGDPARMRLALAGLKAYQGAPRPPRPPEMPVVARIGRVTLRSYGGGGRPVLFVPSLVSHRGYWRVRYATQARAQENQLYVCVAAIFGDLGIPEDLPLTCHGGSYVTCPIDNRFNIENGLFAEAPFDQEGVLTAELDFDLLKLSRERGEIRNVLDRRPELYKQLGD